MAISIAGKFSVSNSRPSGKTGPFLVHCIFLLQIHTFLVPWRRFRTVQLTSKRWECSWLGMSLRVHLDKSCGELLEVSEISAVGIRLFFIHLWTGLWPHLSGNYSSFLDCSGRAFLKYWCLTNKQSSSLHRAVRPHLTQGPGNRLLWVLQLFVLHVIFLSTSGEWHRTCPHRFRWGQLHSRQPSSSQEI